MNENMKLEIWMSYLENFCKQQTHGHMCLYPLKHSKLNLWKTAWHMLGSLRILSYRDVYCVWQPKQDSKHRNLTSEAGVIMLFLSRVLVHFHHWLSSGPCFIEWLNEHRHTHKTVWFINTPVREWQSEYLPQLCQQHLVYTLMPILWFFFPSFLLACIF